MNSILPETHFVYESTERKLYVLHTDHYLPSLLMVQEEGRS